MSKMAAWAHSVLRFRDLKVEKSYLDAWKAGKVICSIFVVRIKKVFLKMFCFGVMD